MSDSGGSRAGSRSLIDHWPWLVALLALAMGLASVGYPRTTLDSPSSTYIGATILEGGFPYRDAWDLRAPGVYFAYALNIALFGKSAFAMRVFDLLWQTGTAFVVFAIALRLSRQRNAALLAAGLYVVGYYSQHYSTWVQPDGFLNLPMALSCWLGMRACETDRLSRWTGAAFALGIAALFKLPFGLFGIALLGAALAVRADWGRRVVRMVALATGITTAFVLCAAWFWSGGALQDLLDAQFRFAPAYVSRIHALTTLGDVLAQFARPVVIPFFALAALAVAAIPWAVRQGPRAPLPAILLLAWLATGLLTILAQGSYLLYHLHPLLAPLALLAAPRLAAGSDGPARGQARARVLFRTGLATLVLVAGAKLLVDARFTWRELSVASSDVWLAPGQLLKERTAPEETIFVWGNVPALYIHADRRAGCRFLPTAFLSVDVPGLDYHQSCLDELVRNRPAYIVLVPDGPVTPGTEDTLTSYEGFPGLMNLVETQYFLEERGPLYHLYRRKPA